MRKTDIRRPPNRLRELREARGLSEAQLGEMCIPPMTATQIDKREKGITKLSVQDMERLAEALGVHPGDLFNRPLWNEEERAIVGLYRELAETDRRAAYRVIDAMAKSSRGNGNDRPGPGAVPRRRRG